MAKKQKINLKNQTQEELHALLKKAREELLTMQLDNSRRKLKDLTSFSVKKDEIARILSAIREKELQNG